MKALTTMGLAIGLSAAALTATAGEGHFATQNGDLDVAPVTITGAVSKTGVVSPPGYRISQPAVGDNESGELFTTDVGNPVDEEESLPPSQRVSIRGGWGVQYETQIQNQDSVMANLEPVGDE